MAFDPKAEPCNYCGREVDECICELAPDFPNDEILELDTDYLSWDHYEEDSDEGNGTEDSAGAEQDDDGD